MPPNRGADPRAVIRAQVVLEEHDLAPEGEFAVVVRRIVERNRYLSHLWLVPLGGRRIARPRRLTSGAVRDSRPRISPDGRRVAFLRRLPDDPRSVNRLRVLELDRTSARPWAVSRPHHEVSVAEWSQDGGRLAFTAAVDPPRFIVGPAAPLGEAPLARVIRRIDWRFDEEGVVDRWSHLFVVDAARSAMPCQLTDGDWGVGRIAWHPDGSTIAFDADRGPDADLYPGGSIWAVDASEAQRPPRSPRLLLALASWAGSPAWSPDGRWLAVTGVDMANPTDEISPTLFVGPADGHSRAVALDPDLDRPIGHWVDADLTGWTAASRPGPAWLDDSTVVAIVSERGRALPHAFRFDPRTGVPAGPARALVTGDADCTSLAVGGGGVSLLGPNAGRAPELMTVDGGELRPRTTFGSSWQRRFPWPEMRLVRAAGPAGDIETWVASPVGSGDTPLPTVVDIHGGPLGSWGPTPAVEAMLLASRGYRVLLPNIRGSATYGRAWIAPHLGDWGGVDADDIHAVADHAVMAGLTDPDRIGLLGLSYGGFLVHWLIGTSDRFRAAVSENGVVNQVSAWAGSDTGVEFNRSAGLGSPLTADGVDALWRQSPLRHVAAIRTPLLMLQGEADLRCPPSDAEQLFTALRVLGREVEYVLYPEETHELQAVGRPDRRADRMTRMLDWFDRHLLGVRS
jgi:dipeptidyl aminopeptidase/acylaminoacyl peptidase